MQSRKLLHLINYLDNYLDIQINLRNLKKKSYIWFNGDENIVSATLRE